MAAAVMLSPRRMPRAVFSPVNAATSVSGTHLRDDATCAMTVYGARAVDRAASVKMVWVSLIFGSPDRMNGKLL